MLSSARDHLFIYCITHEGVPESTLSLHADNGNGLDDTIMGRDSTLKLLGPSPTYTASPDRAQHETALEMLRGVNNRQFCAVV